MNSSVELQPNLHAYTKNTFTFHHQAPLSPSLHAILSLSHHSRFYLYISLQFS